MKLTSNQIENIKGIAQNKANALLSDPEYSDNQITQLLNKDYNDQVFQDSLDTIFSVLNNDDSLPQLKKEAVMLYKLTLLEALLSQPNNIRPASLKPDASNYLATLKNADVNPFHDAKSRYYHYFSKARVCADLVCITIAALILIISYNKSYDDRDDSIINASVIVPSFLIMNHIVIPLFNNHGFRAYPAYKEYLKSENSLNKLTKQDRTAKWGLASTEATDRVAMNQPLITNDSTPAYDTI